MLPEADAKRLRKLVPAMVKELQGAQAQDGYLPGRLKAHMDELGDALADEAALR